MAVVTTENPDHTGEYIVISSAYRAILQIISSETSLIHSVKEKDKKWSLEEQQHYQGTLMKTSHSKQP